MTDVRVLLLDSIQEVMQASEKNRQQVAVKRSIAYLWQLMPEKERRAFLDKVDFDGDCSLTGKWLAKFPVKGDPKRSRVSEEIEEAARNWGHILPGLNKSELELGKQVAKSIRIGRTPSPTQKRFMALKLSQFKQVHSQSANNGGRV